MRTSSAVLTALLSTLLLAGFVWSQGKTFVDLDSIQTLINKTISGLNGDGVFNVKYYGAQGNDSADDTSSIQQAFDACITERSGTIVFPTGSYRVTALTLAAAGSQIHCNLEGRGGAGANGVRLLYVGSGGTALTIKNNTRYHFKDLAIENHGSGTVGLALSSLSSGCNHGNALITNLKVQGFQTNVQAGTTDNKAFCDSVFINLEVSNATTGLLIQGPSRGANFTTVLHFIHLAGSFNGTSVKYVGPPDNNLTTIQFDSASLGQNTIDFDFRAPVHSVIRNVYTESDKPGQLVKSGSSTATSNSAVLTNIIIEGVYAGYPSSPSNFVAGFYQPGHYEVRNSTLATGSIELGGYDGGAGPRRSYLKVEGSTIVSAAPRIQCRAKSNTIWTVRHYGSGYTAEEAANTDIDRQYTINTSCVETAF